jgi:membrane protein required for colicin V production
MTLDLIVLALVALGGIFGARSGASRQIASWGALIVAALVARPGASLLGPTFGRAFHTTPSLGAVAAGFAIFITVAVLVRLVATTVLRGVLAGRDPADRGTDRALGFLLGAVKVLAVAWVALSALAFVEDNVQVAGKGLGISPKDSTAFAAARKWNLFAAPAFAQAADLVKAQEVFRSPQLFSRVASEPAVAELQKNRYFRAVFADPEVKAALERGDTLGLLKLDSVHRLLQDPQALSQLAALRTALDRNTTPAKK